MGSAIRTMAQASERLEPYTQDIKILAYAGRATDSKSVFLNLLNQRVFTTSLSDLIKRLKKEEDPCKIGANGKSIKDQVVSAKKTPEEKQELLKQELEAWLQKNVPHVRLVEFSGSFNRKSLFERKDVGSRHYLEANRLKDKWRRGLQLFPTKEEVVQRRLKTQRAKGYSYDIDGKSAAEAANDLGVAYSTFQSTLKSDGLEVALSLRPSESRLETIVGDILDKHSIEYVHNRKLSPLDYRPDFFIPGHNIVIECDGLYWHSDAIIKDKYYHYNKRKEYTAAGYQPLFFREHEIVRYPHIVESMILYRCSLSSERYFARKMTLGTGTPDFFRDNHLMSAGRGRVFTLEHKGEPVAALQVCRIKEDVYEVSRFCTKAGVTVTGGFSKLVSHASKTLRPSELHTFVDLRYGSGDYLRSLGFERANIPKPSFCWVGSKKVFHRMKFPGNTGYEKGLFKLWDCGQARWKLTLHGARGAREL